MELPAGPIARRRRRFVWWTTLPTALLAGLSLALAYAGRPDNCDKTSLGDAAISLAYVAVVCAVTAGLLAVIIAAVRPGARAAGLIAMGLAGASALVAVCAVFVASPFCFDLIG